MLITKNKISSGAIVKSSSTRNLSTVPVRSKRTVSLKPSIKLTPSAPCDLLPPLKTTIDVKKYRHELPKEKRKPSRNAFDQRILNNKQRELRANLLPPKAAKNPQGLSKQELVQRKQSHLNSYFNVRKNKLKQITHENKRIYVKINSQKSLYSSRELNKSYESNSGLSRRLSQSKLSRSSSRQSVEGGSSRKPDRRGPEGKKEIRIESHDINKVEGEKITRYLNIFCNHINIKSTQTEKSIGKQALTFQFNRLDKENKGPSQAGRLEKIIQESSLRPKRRFLALLQ